MKANSKRKIFGDAVDLLMGDMEEVTMPKGVQMVPVKSIQPFHDHPFHLYEGERLEDMIASVKEHGVLNPVIVQKLDTGYEMLSGHNRWNAAKLAGLKEIPAIVKTDLSEEEAYVYVIETNLMQRSFSDLAISEKAAVLKARYEKGSCQGKRNDILNEIARLEGKQVADVTCGHSDHKLKTRDSIGKEYELSGSSVGRLLKLNDLVNSDELLLDVPRLQREKVLFKDVISSIPAVTSPEQLFFPLGRTPNGKDLIEDLSQMPHMLVGGSTGSGKSVFLFTMLAAMLMTHPKKEDMQLILSSSKLEDFIHFEGLPHLYSGKIISDAAEATKVIKEVIFEESERRGRLLAEARVANIIEYNKKVTEKLAPIVVVIDEFADLADQLETTKEKNAFYKPVQRIAQAGRSRGIHLVICTQRPEAKLVPSTTKAQLNGRVALRVNDGISSRMIIEEPDAQYLQKHGDMIYRNGDVIERAQGYLIEIEELDKIVDDVIHGKI